MIEEVRRQIRDPGLRRAQPGMGTGRVRRQFGDGGRRWWQQFVVVRIGRQAVLSQAMPSARLPSAPGAA